jgi:hypothetical protein
MTKEKKQSTEAAVRDIRRRTRRKFSPEEKIRIGDDYGELTLHEKVDSHGEASLPRGEHDEQAEANT